VAISEVVNISKLITKLILLSQIYKCCIIWRGDYRSSEFL